MSPDTPIASALTGGLEVLGVWFASVAVFSGAGGAWALLTNQGADEIARQAAFGAAAGFLIGIPLAISAAILQVGLS